MLAALFTLALSSATSEPGWYEPDQAVASFQIHRFAGQWFEIARTLAWDSLFSRNTRTTFFYLGPTHMYALRQLDCPLSPVTWRHTFELVAPDARHPGAMFTRREHLGVVRHRPFNIIAVADDYTWAVVGDPMHEEITVLARTWSLKADTLGAIMTHVENDLGYPNARRKMRCTPQPHGVAKTCNDILAAGN